MHDKNKELNSCINEYSCHIRIKDEGSLKATVILQYRDIKIKGFRISNSKHENNDQNLWLQVPSYRTGNFWQKMFFLENKETWAKLEAKILKSYKEESDKYYKKKFGLNHSQVEEVAETETNIDDIEF